jgi:ubiquinone/menaquinone biosynthesis C-methylase UbiE
MEKTLNEPRTYWDHLVEDGRTYQMGSQIHRVFLLDLLKRIGVKSFLDVGCGTGPLYEMLMDAPLGKYLSINDYKGVDYADRMIRVCEDRFPKGDFEVQDARFLKEDTTSWDAVVLMHCLDHLDDYQAAIDEASRVAKLYVVVILWRPLTTNGQNNLNDRNSYDRTEGQWEDTYLQEYSEEKLIEAFEKANLELIEEYFGPEVNNETTSNRLYLLKKL